MFATRSIPPSPLNPPYQRGVVGVRGLYLREPPASLFYFFLSLSVSLEAVRKCKEYRQMKFLNVIDKISELTGKGISWIVLILTAILGYEVLMRYFFNAPTKWVYDISYMLGGTFFLVGASYTLRMKGHVRIDIFYNRFSPRGQALIDVIFTVIFFLPLWIGLCYKLIPYVYLSWQIGERSLESYWRPPIYPFKTVMPIGVFLLILQGIAEFIRSLLVLMKRRPL